MDLNAYEPNTNFRIEVRIEDFIRVKLDGAGYSHLDEISVCRTLPSGETIGWAQRIPTGSEITSELVFVANYSLTRYWRKKRESA